MMEGEWLMRREKKTDAHVFARARSVDRRAQHARGLAKPRPQDRWWHPDQDQV